MAKPRLHLDADTSIRQLQRALIERGHAVTRTPNDWISAEADDEAQLLGATAQGRVTFTFNVHGDVVLAERHPRHGGIALAAQRQWTVRAMIAALDRMLTETNAEAWVGPGSGSPAGNRRRANERPMANRPKTRISKTTIATKTQR